MRAELVSLFVFTFAVSFTSDPSARRRERALQGATNVFETCGKRRPEARSQGKILVADGIDFPGGTANAVSGGVPEVVRIALEC